MFIIIFKSDLVIFEGLGSQKMAVRQHHDSGVKLSASVYAERKKYGRDKHFTLQNFRGVKFIKSAYAGVKSMDIALIGLYKLSQYPLSMHLE